MHRFRWRHGLLLGLCLAALLIARLPGTADVNVWKAWADGLAREGVVAGYNAGTGHMLHPPLGMVLLYAAHAIPDAAGYPVHVWPAAGWTGFKVILWGFLCGGVLLVFRLTGSAGWAAAFLLTFLLNSVVYGAFDIFGVPFLLLAVHALAERQYGRAAFWGVVTLLIKYQFLLLLPFALLYAVREYRAARSLPAEEHSASAVALLPAAVLLTVMLLVFGPGTWLSFSRGLAHDTLSGYALNFGWILTWAMHLRWPESYGPLEEGLITVLRTRDTRVLLLVRLLFGTAYLLALWRQWRAPHTIENLLRCMLAGYLAYFLLNRGAHENHLVPAMAVAGYLAWRYPRWTWTAVLIVIAANLNLFFFYTLWGQDRGAARVVAGFDTSLALAVAYVVVLGLTCLRLIDCWPRHGFGHANRRAAAAAAP